MGRLLPRLVVAGPATGVGKTTAAAALMAALVRTGRRIAPFKAGPDYIDGGYHALAAGRPSRNLDAWFLRPAGLRRALADGAAGADLAVIEGVMGLFDGLSPDSDAASTAEIARVLGCPVLFVVDASAQSRSAAALVAGFKAFDRRVRLAGVILNNAPPSSFTERLASALSRATRLPVVGRIPPNPLYRLPERHLGLVPAWEHPDAPEFLEALLRDAPSFFDIAAVERIAGSAAPLGPASAPAPAGVAPPVRIAYAFDPAFRFYYAENLDLLARFGAELVPVSPLADAGLPPEVGALYLGGGFPEVFARRLAANGTMKRSVRDAARSGLPVYAECGGLMYLAESLTTSDGEAHPMCGILPGMVEMTPRLQHFGYTEVRTVRDTLLAPEGAAARGHSFHHSRWEGPGDRAAYRAASPGGEPSRLEGYARGNLLASYVHLYFPACPEWARRFVGAARRFARASRSDPGRSKSGARSSDPSTSSAHRSTARKRSRA